MRYGIAVLGALAGALFGAAVWRFATLPDPLIWAGGLASFIAGGLLSFSSSRAAIMLFTCIEGSALVVAGMLALLHDYPQMTEGLTNAVYAACVFAAGAAVGAGGVGDVCAEEAASGGGELVDAGLVRIAHMLPPRACKQSGRSRCSLRSRD